MMTQLDTITIDELCQRARAKGLDRPPMKAAQPSQVVA
jgi:hypothetical protein